MGTVLTIIAMAAPRVLMFFIWAMTDWFDRSFTTELWPILGLLFMPCTTLAYMAGMLKNDHSITGVWLVLLVAGVIADSLHIRSGASVLRTGK